MFHVKHGSPPALQFLDDAIGDLDRATLLRSRPVPTDGVELSFCSNDYLALAQRPAPPRPAGAGASRLVAGERVDHVQLEQAAAAYVGMPSALVFTSGYAANLGLLSALAGPGDLVVSDALNHASIVDGARLSRAQVIVTPHLEVEAVDSVLRKTARRRAFVVTESYFSMDADSPDLAALRAVCDAHGAALLVDEAHALGVLGPEGHGLCAAAGVVPDAITGTFGKSFGAGGAFVAGCSSLVTWLWNRARSFVFSTGLSPALASAAAAGVAAAQAEPQRRERALAAAAQLRDGFARLGIRPLGFGHVIPWVLGEPAAAVRASEVLRGQGIDVRAIRPPSVPLGTARLRFAVTAGHQSTDIERAVEAIGRAGRGAGA
jgi:8-amino-7-oxononanoate synthase